MYLLLGAMDAEISLIKSSLAGRQDKAWRGFPIFTGELLGLPVVLARTGVGKTMAALLTQRLIDTYAPEGIIFSGIAGSLNPAYEIGDLVIARDCVQYDMDAGVLGFPRGKIPYTDYRFLPADPELLAKSRDYRPGGGAVHFGRILTGDQFVAQKDQPCFAGLDGDAVEMEGASAALAAAINGIPFLLVRTISDKADGRAPGDFKKFLARAAAGNFAFLSYLISRI